MEELKKLVGVNCEWDMTCAVGELLAEIERMESLIETLSVNNKCSNCESVDKITTVEAEIERLKCCGNCKLWNGARNESLKMGGCPSSNRTGKCDKWERLGDD
jgi:hypothetical protein